MQFQAGNKFWLARSSHGRNPIFKSPDELWNAACEYFEWVQTNPLYEEKIFHAQGIITKDTITKMRAMTISGLCLFISISHDTWQRYRDNPDFCVIVKEIEAIIYNQKFTGAAADLLNPNIIARELGLADKQQAEIKITDVKELTNEQLAIIAAGGSI